VVNTNFIELRKMYVQSRPPNFVSRCYSTDISCKTGFIPTLDFLTWMSPFLNNEINGSSALVLGIPKVSTDILSQKF
jgi:hypothetical protein